MRPQRDPVGPGQCNVWDFPRPAIAELCNAHIRIEHRGIVIAETREAVCTFETSHPPGYYILPHVITPGVLRRAQGSSFCEWKGAAINWDVAIGGVVLPVSAGAILTPAPALPSCVITSLSTPGRSIAAP